MLYIDYFSPTGGVKNLVFAKAKQLRAENDNGSVIYRSFNKPKDRDHNNLSFLKEDCLILGLPVYAGRIPNLLLEYLSSYSGHQTPIYLVFGYGNRHFDDAPKEAYRLFKENGFVIKEIICAVCEHSFSSLLAKDEPSRETLDIISKVNFSRRLDLARTLASNVNNNKVEILELNRLDDQTELMPYYRPVDANGIPFNFIKIKPVTGSTCIACGMCASMCTMDAISTTDFKLVTGKCIKCCACVKGCPVGAKAFNDENFLKHKCELEESLKNINHPITIFTKSQSTEQSE